MSGPRIGSLFSGYGGLDLGVMAAIGGAVAWHCEVNPAASRVLDHHWPDVPNLGDITAVEWSSVEPVDVICGGSPCQDVSAAGKRAGMRAGTRSGLWASMVDAIDIIRPQLAIWENVRGVTSAEADSGMEFCPGCVGDADDGPVLRALGRVLGDLADIGYDARWCGLRASDVGAPHGRFRVFVVAHPVGVGGGWERGWAGQLTGAPVHAAGHGDATAHPFGVRRFRRGSGPGSSAGGRAHGEPPRCDTGPATADPIGSGRDGRAPEPLGCAIGGTTAAGRGIDAAPDADGHGLRVEPVTRAECGSSSVPANPIQWGRPYEPAIRRWERATRPAPAPTETGPKGGQRLSPRFTEWMMGLPDGWVCDVPGVTRNEQLSMLGNGVVWQQAATAIRWALGVEA